VAVSDSALPGGPAFTVIDPLNAAVLRFGSVTLYFATVTKVHAELCPGWMTRPEGHVNPVVGFRTT